MKINNNNYFDINNNIISIIVGLISDFREEEAFIMEKYRMMGTKEFWLNYKNHNGTYKIDDEPVQKKQYMGAWNKDHTGKDEEMLILVHSIIEGAVVAGWLVVWGPCARCSALDPQSRWWQKGVRP